MKFYHPLFCNTKFIYFFSAMSGDNNRAAWAFSYEKGLVDILKDHNNIPMFKGHNGWSPKGWRSITKKFNEKFPLLHFTKQQIKEKERVQI